MCSSDLFVRLMTVSIAHPDQIDPRTDKVVVMDGKVIGNAPVRNDVKERFGQSQAMVHVRMCRR